MKTVLDALWKGDKVCVASVMKIILYIPKCVTGTYLFIYLLHIFSNKQVNYIK